MIDVSGTASIFELSFGINLIFSLLTSMYLQNKHILYKVIKNKFDNENIDSTVEQRHLIKAIDKSFPKFKFLNTWFFYIAISLSIWAISTSFYYLVLGAIDNNSIINKYTFLLYSCFFLIINPIIYFLFNSFSKNVTEEVLDKKIQLNIDSLKRLNRAGKMADLSEKITIINYDINKVLIIEYYKNMIYHINIFFKETINPFYKYKEHKFSKRQKRYTKKKSNKTEQQKSVSPTDI